jgi:hypothetical protein
MLLLLCPSVNVQSKYVRNLLGTRMKPFSSSRAVGTLEVTAWYRVNVAFVARRRYDYPKIGDFLC